MRKLLAPLFCMFLLTACASNQPTPEQIMNADYGQSPDNYQEIVKDFMSRSLFDPYSAVFSGWRGPSKGYVYDYSGRHFGYRVCVDINGKNRLGAFVGSKQYAFLINNARVLWKEGGYRDGTVGEEHVAELCNFR